MGRHDIFGTVVCLAGSVLFAEFVHLYSRVVHADDELGDATRDTAAHSTDTNCTPAPTPTSTPTPTPAPNTLAVEEGNWAYTSLGVYPAGRNPLQCLNGPLDNSNAAGDQVEVYFGVPQTTFAAAVRDWQEVAGSRFRGLKTEHPWWDKDLSDSMVCTSCCDGRQVSCASHFYQTRPLQKRTERMFRGQMAHPFMGAIKDGIMYQVDNATVNKDALLKTGLPIHPHLSVASPECDVWVHDPVVILKNGDWMRETAKSNVGHWLADVMGLFLHIAQHYNVKRVMALIPNCPISKPGPTKQCRTFPVAFEEGHLPHLKSTPFRGGTDWVFQTAERLGLPWLRDILLRPPQLPANKVTCFSRLVWGCPVPRACPTAKYVATLMPLYKHWLHHTYGLTFERPPVIAVGGTGKTLLMLLRDPDRSRYISNWETLGAAAKESTTFKRVETLSLWNATPDSYTRIVNAFQSADVVLSMHGADLSLAITLMAHGSVAVEILPKTAVREDPFYVYQAFGSKVHLIRWLLHLPDIPGWTAFDLDPRDERGRYRNHYSWRRQLVPFPLPVESLLTVLRLADSVLSSTQARPLALPSPATHTNRHHKSRGRRRP